MNDSVKKAVLKVMPFKRLLKRGGLMLVNVAHSLRGDAYYCSALSGESDYNICINSDMSVSCNCMDIDGSGHIGDLSANTLQEIFDGPTATRFRKSLSRGVVPIKRCLTCRERRKVSQAEARAHVTAYTTPKAGIMVENTVQCNLKCVNCSRRAILKTRKKLKMSLQDMEKVAREIRDNQIGLVNFFNLGEPFLSDTISEELALLKKYNPDTPVYISTNGVLIKQPRKLEAALLADYIFVSLDGATNESVTKYQAGGNFEASYANMKELVRLRNARQRSTPVVDWKYVVFSWNDSEAEIERAVALAREAKVDILSFWPCVGTPEQQSSRFPHEPYFQKLGVESWKGREIDFRKPAP